MTIEFLKGFGKHFPNELMLFQTNNLEDLNFDDFFDFANLKFTTYHIDKIEIDKKYIFLLLEPSNIKEKKSMSVTNLINQIRKLKKVEEKDLLDSDEFDNVEVVLLINEKNKKIRCAYNIFLPYTLPIPLYSTTFFTVLPYVKKCDKNFTELYSEYFIEDGKKRLEKMFEYNDSLLKENTDIGKPEKTLYRNPLVLSDDIFEAKMKEKAKEKEKAK